MTIVVLAEKPSVARDIATVLGATERRGGSIEGNGYVVTWAIGHLVGLAQPGDIREEWRRWDPAQLPMIPEEFPLVARDGHADQLKLVGKLFNARGVREIVCATDAGREGELIFRLIYQAVECTKPCKRLWISSLTPDAIKDGFRNLKPSSAFDALADAARARSEADWLVGMNLSRAYSLASGDSLNVGRVKTPTLAMVVARELAVMNFVPHPYREVEATFATEVGEVKATYVRGDFDAKTGKPILNPKLPAMAPTPPDPLVTAELILARARAGAAKLKRVDEDKAASPPPMLFDLTELQRTANRLWGWTAAYTLEVTQELYEKYKLLSYPRTDSRHLSQTVAATLDGVVRVVRGRYESLLADGTGARPLTRRFVDDSKVSDHHAIIPTGTPPTSLDPASDAGMLYDLVCRRFLSAWQPDAIEATTKVEFTISSDGIEDRYTASGKAVLRPGWRALDLTGRKSAEKESELPGGLRAGIATSVRDARIVQKQTQPPKFFTEATLLSAMESAGASLEDELSDAMKERGLGTPATRAAMIEELVAKGYMTREGKALRPTELGIALVRRVHAHVASPALTGEWESRLRRIERGQGSADALLREVRQFVQNATREALAGGVAPRKPRPTTSSVPERSGARKAPRKKAAKAAR